MEGLGVAANVIAVVHLSVKVISWCYKYSGDVKNAKKDIERVQKETINLKNAAEAVQRLLEGQHADKLQTSQKLLVAIVQSHAHLKEMENALHQKTRHQAMSRFGLRALKWPFESDDVEKLILDLSRCAQTIQFALQVDQTNVILDMDTRAILGQIPIAEGAAFDSDSTDLDTTCLPNTRVQLLEDISKWVNDDHSKPLMWLSGKAGTGKSTISRTVCQSLEAAGHLGATFFFKVGESDRSSLSRVFTTIAADLVVKVPRVRHHVKDAIENEPDIFRKPVGKQLDTLILQPLLDSQSGHPRSPIVIVIDALDECERDEDIRRLIALLTKASLSRLRHLKIFLTSRPELPIRLGFNLAAPETFQPLTLHQIADDILEHDIRIFLEHHLAQIRTEYNMSDLAQDQDLPPDWPGEEKIQALARMSMPLFIFAATVCRFIGQLKLDDPDTQLDTVFEFGTGSQNSHYDKTYLPVLNRLVAGLSGKQSNDVFERFHLIVGSVILLATPLSKTTLAQILGIKQRSIDTLVGSLHSVIRVPSSPTSPLRLFHLSFRDFLLNSDKEKNPFWVDKTKVHANLAARCLIVLEKTLKQNICDIEDIATPRKSIEMPRISEHLPADIQYACCHWVHHYEQAGISLKDNGQVHRFLKVHLLHWLEALSLLGKIYDCTGFVLSLGVLTDPTDGKNLLELLGDARPFLLSHANSIDAFPLQLYSSLLAFTPTESTIRKMYKSTMEEWVSVVVSTETGWGDCLQTLEGHTGNVNGVDISHDSELIASASSDGTIRIWSTRSGECLRIIKDELEAQLDNDFRERLDDFMGKPKRNSGWGFLSVAFSADSSLLLTTSPKSAICTWNVATGERVLVMEESLDWTTAAVFSRTGEFIAAGLGDEVRIWQRETGACVHYFDAGNEVASVTFSRNSKLIGWCGWCASGKREQAQVWDINSKTCMLSVELDFGPAKIAFSHDSKSLVVGGPTHNFTRMWTGVEIYCIANGKMLAGPSFNNAGIVTSIAFSDDLALVASNSKNGETLIWDMETKENVQALQGPIGILSAVVFSRDSALLVSAGDDSRVRVWRTPVAAENEKGVRGESRDCVIRDRYCQGVQVAMVSEDLSLIAIMGSRTLQMWNTATGECQWSTDFVREAKSVRFRWVFSPGSAFLVILKSFGNVSLCILRSNTGERLAMAEEEQIREINFFSLFLYLKPMLNFSPGSALVSGICRDEYLRIWDTKTGKCIQRIRFTTVPAGVDFSLDLKAMAMWSEETFSIWRATDNEFQKRIELKLTDDQSYKTAMFSPDSALIALLQRHHVGVHIRRCDTGHLVHKLRTHGAVLKQIGFTPESSHLLAFSRANEIQAWNVETGVRSHFFKMPRLWESVDLTDIGSRLIANNGAIEEGVMEEFEKYSFLKNHVNIGERWIEWNDGHIFLLPPEYQGRWYARISGPVVRATNSKMDVTLVIVGDSSRLGKTPITRIWILHHPRSTIF